MDHYPYSQKGSLNLKVVLKETGLSADTVRAWERRYGLPRPERTPGGHRLYTARDIQMLNWLTDRQKEGISISRAAELWRSLESEGKDPLLTYGNQPGFVESRGFMLSDLRQAWITACQNFDEQSAEQALAQAFAMFSPEVVCFELIQAGISTIGQGWYEGNTTVQQEHFASALAMRRLHLLLSAAPAPTRPGRILAACPAGEEHEFALLLLAVLLRRRGWDVIYLGANVPIIEMDAALKATKPYLVVSIAETLPSAASLRRMGEFLTTQGVRLAYGGGIINSQPLLRELIPGYYLGQGFLNAAQAVDHLWNLQHPNPPLVPLSQEYQQALQHFLERQLYVGLEVSDRFSEYHIEPTHLDIATQSMQQHISAALELGDIRLVGDALHWLDSFLRYKGLPKQLLPVFLTAYQQALENQIPASDQNVFLELSRLFASYLE